MLGLTLVAGRLVQLQVVEARGLSTLAQKQWRRELEVPARRGTIYDRDGEPLALSVEAYDVYATPYQVTNVPSTAATLAASLGDTPAFWRDRLSRGGGFVWLKRRVDAAMARKLKGCRLPGIGFIPSSRRTYRMGPVASQVVGISGIDGEGLEGLELYYDSHLRGTPGILEAERDPLGRTLPGGLLRSVEPKDGRSIQVSLDSDIQYKAQLELAEAVKANGAAGGMIIVMDVRTGAMLAAVSSPGADPSRLTSETISGLKNRVVTDVLEPGSTMKIVTVAAALDSRTARPNTEWVLPGTLTVGGHTVHEAHARGTVQYTTSDILSHSSNVGAVTLALKLGKDKMYRYIQRFGLTTKTGIDLPGEISGWVPKPKDWSRSSISTIPFGQGISASPIQMARVMATIANRGVSVAPHFLVAKVGTSTAATPGTRVITTQTADALRTILRSAVTSGTGTRAQIPGYTVAGKTGTAQKPKLGARGYAEGKYLASFIGFAPATKPRLVCLVTIDEPGGAYYGGVVAAPTFARVMRFALAHLRVPPDMKMTRLPAPAEATSQTAGPDADAGGGDKADGSAAGSEGGAARQRPAEGVDGPEDGGSAPPRRDGGSAARGAAPRGGPATDESMPGDQR